MLIKITASPYSAGTTLDVNGQRAFVPEAGKSADVPEWMLSSLDNSGIGYEIVGAADEAGVGAEGDQGDAPAETAAKAELDLSFLDGSIPTIIPMLAEMSDDNVRIALAAEQAGKTRTTLIAAMNERLNPPQE